MLIYVSGPYSADTAEARLANVHEACRAGRALMAVGHDIIVPHLSHFMDELATEDGCPVPYERWLLLDLALVQRCDALFLIKPSPGANLEVEFARKLGLPVYRTFAQVPKPVI